MLQLRPSQVASRVRNLWAKTLQSLREKRMMGPQQSDKELKSQRMRQLQPNQTLKRRPRTPKTRSLRAKRREERRARTGAISKRQKITITISHEYLIAQSLHI